MSDEDGNAPEFTKGKPERQCIEPTLTSDFGPEQQAAAHRASADLPTIEGYEVLSKLGQGGMGVVYLARHVSLDRRVALKLLPGGMAGNPLSIQRFLREARSAAALHHTNIVPVFDVGSSDNAHYYAMQLIEGAPLNDVIRDVRSIRESGGPENEAEPSDTSDIAIMMATTSFESNPSTTDVAERAPVELESTIAFDGSNKKTSGSEKNAVSPHTPSNLDPSSENSLFDAAAEQVSHRHYYQLTARLALQVAEALHYAHSNGIVHRDIKPANLMLDRACNVWITDFGLAKSVDDNLSQSGSVVGTLRYMSPERFKGEGDERSDIYALGATLYEMLVFRPAFNADDQVGLMRAIHDETPAKLRTIDRSVPRDLETIVHKCLEKDPRQRYATAQQLADDLRRHVSGEVILARRVTLPERLWLWAKKNRAVAALLSVLVVGALCVAVASSFATVAFQKLAVEARNQADTAVAINEFFNQDILGAGNPMEGNVDRNTTLLTVLNAAAEKIETKFAGKPVVAGQIHLTIGESYLALAEFTRAEKHLSKSQELLTDSLGSDHPDVIDVQLQLGKLYRDSVKDFRRGYRMLDAIQKRRVGELGFDDPLSLEASFELALALTTSDRRGQGIKLLKEVLEARKRVLGPRNRDTVRALLSVGRVEIEEQVRSALPVLQEGLKITESEFGQEDILTVMARSNLADYYMRQQNAEEALRLLNQNLDVCEQWLGENHPRTIRNLTNLMHVHSLSGNNDKAVELARDVVRRTGITHSEASLVTANANLQLVKKMVEAKSQLVEARSIAERIRAFQAEIFGATSEDVAYVDFLLGKIDDLEGKTEAAETRLIRAYDTHRNRLGENDETTIRVMWGLINHYVGQSEFAKAKPLMQKGIEHRLKVYGPNSMATVEVKENLSYVHLQLEEYEEAERLLRECMDVAEHGPIQGVIQAHYANSCRNKLGACFNLQERYPEAAEIVKQSIEYQHWSPASRWKQADAKGILGEALTGMGQYEKAEQVLLEAQRGLEEQTSQMVPVVQERNLKKMAARFASLYEKLGRKADHAKWQRVLDGYDD